MKRIVKIGFPIVCVVVVGGTLIALSNLKSKADKISKERENNITNTYTQESNSVSNEHGYQNLDGLDENEINHVSETEDTSNTNSNNVSNTSTSNSVNENKNTNTSSSSTSNTEEIEKPIENTSDKDKAIALAQEEWGEDSSVYYTNEGISSGLYIVAVRDKSNTSVKMFYKVDLTNNTVEVDW